VALALKTTGFEVIVVEPNIVSHDGFTVLGLDKAMELADVVVFLVKHRQFVELLVNQQIISKVVLDFCGALGTN